MKNMRICIPTETNEGLNSRVCDHFGSAPFFTVYDSDKGSTETVDNGNQHHAHGMCHPLKELREYGIDAVVCRGMGARAITLLNLDGMKAFRVEGQTVEEIVKKYNEGLLEEITVNGACRDHDCH